MTGHPSRVVDFRTSVSVSGIKFPFKRTFSKTTPSVAVLNRRRPAGVWDAGIVEQTCFRWRKVAVCRWTRRSSKELEQENSKLKRLVANLSLDNLVLKDFASGNFLRPERRRIAADRWQKHGMTGWGVPTAKQPRGAAALSCDTA